MKKQVLSFLAILLISFAACGCTNTTQSSTPDAPKAEETKKENPIITASPQFADTLSGILNSGFKIYNKNKVYYTQSADWQKVYFVGSVIVKDGQYYNAVWATNDITFIGAGVVYSMNDHAIYTSGMGDGRTNAEPISESDDGYSRINQKLLDEMMQAIN